MANSIATSILALAIPLTAFLGGARLMSELSDREQAASLQKPLMMRWGYSASEVARYWGTFEPHGLAGERRFLEIDLIFPFVYGGALATSMLLLWAALGRSFSPAPLVGVVAVTMLADWTENLVQLRQISLFTQHGYTALQANWISLASVATIVKLVGTSASVVALLGLVVASILRAPH